MVTQVCTYDQTYQITYINYMQIFIYQLYPNKAGKKH